MDFERFLLFCAFDQGLPPFLGAVDSAWAANEAQHRLLLKKAASAAVHASVSHAPMRGGFVGLTEAHPSALQLGFDLEDIERVTEAAAARVASPRDHSFSPLTPAHLWCAREAAFKALKGDCQPLVVSQIALTDWRTREHDILQFTFTATGASSGQGYLWDDGEFQYALALWTPASHNEKGCRTPT
ncbi:MAG: 4'-phosphopantetheinyl transferase superfamily protein [Bdellovibrionaceae bacterium]|nr:4'-phosphopantetheinyl transferase superfamily protein [Pseudobdellovibrionaceae bacterium]